MILETNYEMTILDDDDNLKRFTTQQNQSVNLSEQQNEKKNH